MWEFTSLDDDVMRHFGLFEEIQSYLEVGHIKRMFEIKGQGHMELTLEFLCTLRVDVNDLPNEMPKLITFRVAGMLVSIAMQQFCTTMGLYEECEIEDPTVEKLHMSWPTSPTQFYGISTMIVSNLTLAVQHTHPYFARTRCGTCTELWPGGLFTLGAENI